MATSVNSNTHILTSGGFTKVPFQENQTETQQKIRLYHLESLTEENVHKAAKAILRELNEKNYIYQGDPKVLNDNLLNNPYLIKKGKILQLIPSLDIIDLDNLRSKLTRAEQSNHSEKKFNALCALGNAHQFLGNHKHAQTFYYQCLSMTSQLDNVKLTSGIYYNLMNAHHSCGEIDESITFFSKHSELIGDTKDNHGTQRAFYSSVGDAYQSQKNYAEAIKWYIKYAKIAEQANDQHSMKRAYFNLGDAYHSLNNFEDALKYYQKYLTIAQGLEENESIKRAYCNIGEVHLFLGNYKESIQFFSHYLEIRDDLESLTMLKMVYNSMESAYNQLNDHMAAKIYHDLANQTSNTFVWKWKTD